MASTQSAAAPPPSSDDNAQNPGVVQQLNAVPQEAREEATEPTPKSVFMNSEPIREDQVQNAVKFLSHPNVRTSPVIHRRSFLEKKGLTKEEIDEAFRRVPDPPPSAQTTGQVQQGGQVTSTPSIQTPASTQALQTPAAAPSAVISSAGALRSRFQWYHAVLAVGFLAASGAGTAVLIKNTVVPRLKSWIRKVVLEEEEENHGKKANAKPSLAEEAAAAAKAAAAAAADVAKASQEMLNSKNEEKRYFQEFMNLLDVQVQEMKSMSTAICKLEGQSNNIVRNYVDHQEDHRVSVANPKTYDNGRTEFDSRSARSSLPSASAEPAAAPPHPKSYMEIMEMVQRGERPSNIRDINDQPPNPNQQISNPRLAPRAKPWEAVHGESSSGQVLQSQVNVDHSKSMMQDNGVTYQFNGESTAPWLQRKAARITEIENEDEFKTGSDAGRMNAQPVQRRWVPPQPPPVAMPEAAEAIRRPKPSVQKEQLAEDQSASRPADVTDELRSITKFSESGGALDSNGGVSGLNSGEIQEEQEHIHEGN